MESMLRGDGGPADLRKIKGQGHEHACTKRNLGNDRTTTKAASVRKHLGTKNSMSNEGRDGSAEELNRETGEEQTIMGRTCRKDGE